VNDITRMFIGTWGLVHTISIGADGQKEYPFGPDAIGFIYYSDTGVMAVQISRRTRQASADHSNLHREYLAYFGLP
jgi:Lipocalin-like domain